MEEGNSTAPSLAGSTLILSGICIAGIVASLAFSAYAAIALGFLAFILAVFTGEPRRTKDRIVVFSLAGLATASGIGAIALGVVARALS